MKIAYIIPGFRESTKQEKYKKITRGLRKKGFIPINVKIKWKYKTMSNYVNQFLKKYQHHDNQSCIIIGFSFGAMIAFIVSSKINVKEIFLCSLSPYFKEDLPRLKKTWKRDVGKKRIKALENYSFGTIGKKIKCKITFLAGAKEGNIILKRINEAGKKLSNGKVYIIKDVGHDISNEKYLNELLKKIK